MRRRDAALPSFDELHLRWFDRWLRDIDNGVEEDPPVRIFVMGGGDGHRTQDGRLFHGGTWREEREWPLARAFVEPQRRQEEHAVDPIDDCADQTHVRDRPRDHAEPAIVGGVASRLIETFTGPALPPALVAAQL